MRAWFFLGIIVLLISRLSAADQSELVANGDVENGTSGWSALWTRDPSSGTATIEKNNVHGGAACWQVAHHGVHDWSLAQEARWTVTPGDILTLSAWVRCHSGGAASLSFVTRTADGTVASWDYAGQNIPTRDGWQHLTARLIIPASTATVQFRLIGTGPCVVDLDDVSVMRSGTVDGLRTPGLPPSISITDARLTVTLRTHDATLTVNDRRIGRTWLPAPTSPGMVVLAAAVAAPDRISLELLDAKTLHACTASVTFDGSQAELHISVEQAGPMTAALQWPPAFASQPDQALIMPVNEGISYPVADATLPTMHYDLYGGHGLCMPWYGAVDDSTRGTGAGWMAIVDTADDAAVQVTREQTLLQLVPEWQPQRGAFGAARRMRYVFLDHGGYVAMTKRYRAFSQATGLFRTLVDKRRSVPAVDHLVGAVNVWCWDQDAVSICQELRQAGITRILWSNSLPADQITALNAMDVLTSRYDLYQDSMDPAQFPKLKWLHPDWTSSAWARGDLLRDADGRTTRGWEVEAKDGTMIPCGVLCDRQAVPYARERILNELKTKPYRCRFIDTTTASPWRECWDPAHPMTRSDCKKFRIDLLRLVSEEAHQVVGSETGHDAAVPVVDYFEGMLSLGPYRVPDSGRDMTRLWDDVPADVATFQTGHLYRLPLWELVYHDCVVSHWYWGDYNNKLPSLWDRRDLWNALYGTAPMFMFERPYWHQQRERFARSYQATAPVARATGYSELIDHQWLTNDHRIQRSTFANGVVVTVNFGEQPWTSESGMTLPSMSSHVVGLPNSGGN